MRGRTAPLLAAALCAAALVALYVAAFHVQRATLEDARAYISFFTLLRGPGRDDAEFLAELFNLRPFAVAVAVVLAAAWWAGRLRAVAAVAVLLAGANLTTQLLQQATAAPRVAGWLPEASWPSGHVTAAASLAACVVLIAPPRARPVAIMLAGGGLPAVAYSILLIGTHLPSDVLGGLLVGGLWTGLVAAALGAGRPVAPWACAAMGVLAVAGLLVVMWRTGREGFLGRHETFLPVGVALAAAGAALMALAASARARPRPPR